MLPQEQIIRGKFVWRYVPTRLRRLILKYPCELEMNEFTEEVLREYSLYLEVAAVNYFRSKLDISSSENEEDVVVLPCQVGERVRDQRLANTVDESFLMYMAVLEEFGVTITFTAFEMDVLMLLNVEPSQIRPNSLAFIRGFEILCKALSLEPSAASSFISMGLKMSIKGCGFRLVPILEKILFPPYGAPECSSASVMVEGKPKFPLCWTYAFVVVMGYDFSKMTPYERIWGLATTKTSVEDGKGALALYFDNGFERALVQVLHFHPDAKVDELDPFNVLIDG
ncbi:hypothetical protein MTR_3g050960 [Medicago truncatula]|uniref:Uncharacterized protein n=1 Tax=Medicago truncatula TaxID=3880 RepID=G7J203_MEDTR|nr:hypothetical protein MTR_3g050960 [Medicago truncatula]